MFQKKTFKAIASRAGESLHHWHFGEGRRFSTVTSSSGLMANSSGKEIKKNASY